MPSSIYPFVNTVQILDGLKRYPVFDLATFEGLTGLKHGSARLRLFRMNAHGYVYRLHRDKYTVHRDPLMVASRIAWPSYMSLWYALNKHGLSEQIPVVIEVITTRQVFRKEITFEGMRISFTKIDPRYFFGFEKIWIDGKDIFMALPEKAIVDAVLFRRISVSEIFSMLQNNIGRIDVERLVKFVHRCENGALAKRIGHLLDSLGLDFYKELKDLINPDKVPLDYFLPAEGQVDTKWRVITNITKEVI